MRLRELITAVEDKSLVSFKDAVAYQNQLTCWIGRSLFFIPVIGTDKGILGDENDLLLLDYAIYDCNEAIELAHYYTYGR